ncbi:hypothetical protein [Streptomyces sp. CRN 30]|uniref:hypothetical protein n=1 Tax=Streptomyces sp. CRN 30 TaxID=3075613 RepID=UPI002A8110C7|nr:hypothetical protein [Streptomyces sp. CRN 30]
MRTSIPFQAVAAFLQQLGADPDDTASVEIEPGCVTVSQFRLNNDGARYQVDGTVAMVRTEIPIERSPRDGADEA